MDDNNDDKSVIGQDTAVADQNTKITGEGAYGTRHLMEEAMLKGSPENKDAGSLRSMKKADLLATAEAEGVAIETDDNREDLIRKIEESRG